MNDRSTSKVCPSCGAEARVDARFCMKCGTALGKKASGKVGAAKSAKVAKASAAKPANTKAAKSANADSAPGEGSAYLKATAFDEGSPEARDAKAAKAAKEAKSAAEAEGSGASGQAKASKKTGSKGASGFSGKRKKAAIIAGSVVAALLLVLGIALLSAPKGTTDIGDGYEVTGQRIAFSDGAYIMTGSVKNTTGHDEAFTLTWQVFDEDDQEIGQASTTVGVLKDGESQEFRAQITSASSMFDLIFSGGQQAQTGGPDHFELTDVSLYTESMNQFSSAFNGLFGGYSSWIY